MYDAKSSNPKSFANSSSIVGKFLAFTSLTFTLNIDSFPAKFSAWYSAGNVTLTSTSSPAFLPSNCSSYPGMNDPDPNSKSNPSAFPPSNATPSTNPSKSIFTISPFLDFFETDSILAFFAASAFISSSTSLAKTLTAFSSTVNPLYSFNSTLAAITYLAIALIPASSEISSTSTFGNTFNAILFFSTNFLSSANSLKLFSTTTSAASW